MRQTTLQLLLIVLAFFAACHAKAGPLNEAISRASVRYKVDPRLLRAIAYLESSSGRHTGLKQNTNGTWDIGAFQINSVHWATTCRTYDVTTLQGNAYCTALLLSKHAKHAPADRYWAGMYHSKTQKRKVNYAQKITKVLATLADR